MGLFRVAVRRPKVWLDRWFAMAYDPFMMRVEATGLGAWRREVLSGLEGRVLEIGAGTGANLPHYPGGVSLTLLEPVAPMRERLQARFPGTDIVDGTAEALPFDDEAFDAVVVGLVLCSVGDLSQSLAEIHRVLKPNGRFAFIEHVGSEHPGWRRVQRWLEPLWKIPARGCHLTRDTEVAIQAAGFAFEQMSRAPLPGGFAVVKDAIHGVARRVP